MIAHILVPLDGSGLAECILPHAVAVARTFGGRMTLLRVVEPPRPTGRTLSADLFDWHIGKSEAKAYLRQVALRLQGVGLQTESALVEGRVAESVIQFARRHSVDLIILSSHGRSGLTGWNVSSVVQKVTLRAYMPLMLVRAYRPTASELTGMRYQRLFVPLDCSQRAECVLPVATALARFHKAQLVLMHVVRKPEMSRRGLLTQEDIKLADQITERNLREATKYLNQLEGRFSSQGVEVQTRVVVANNVLATLHETVERENADLVLLSAHGRSYVAKWPYGAVATSFIAYGTTPLLIVQDVPPDEAEHTQAEEAAIERLGH